MTKIIRLSADYQAYLITDRSLFPADAFLPAVETALKSGVRALQLREKDLDADALSVLAREVRALTRKYSAQLIINGRADIAHAVGADGVHLPESHAASAKEIRKTFPRLLIGISTHSSERARGAEALGADFVTFSPIFDTPSKREYGLPQGVGKLREVVRETSLPVIALGGITPERVPSVLDTGAFGVALISGIWSRANIEKSVFDYTRYFGGKSI